MVKNKKALSAMIGYVLLITFGVVMAGIVYSYLKTYVPQDKIDCPTGSSLFLEDYYFDCVNNELIIILKNNGKFNLAGYFIHGANDTTQEVATIDLSKNLVTDGDNLYGSAIVVKLDKENHFQPNKVIRYKFDLADVPDLKRIEIIPIRFQEVRGKPRLVSCISAKTVEDLVCN